MITYYPELIPLDPICSAALRCFTVNGFHGTSIRQIAAEAELSVPGIYHHYPSKSAILEKISDTAMVELLKASRRALASGTNTLEQFEQLVSCLIQFHATYQDIAFVSYSEIRSLPPEEREHHLEQRRQEQALITGIVVQGAAEGLFTTSVPHHAARAITNICMGVSQWYRPGGTESVEDLIGIFTTICLDTVGYRSGGRPAA